jgi:pimeloyl-ACP methyl ester carboxylesterase
MDALQVLRVMLSWLQAYVSYLAWYIRRRPEQGMGRVDVDDISVYYNSYGVGEPVLMLHGGFAYAETWMGQIPALAGYYQVITPDSRGHGRTSLGERPITYRRLAGDFIEFIEKLELGPVHLVGWSDGGCASIAIALQRPDLVRSMVLIGTPNNTDNYTEEAKRLIRDFLDPKSVELLFFRLIHWLLAPEPYSWKPFLERMTEMWLELPDFTPEDLSSIDAPTLVVACDCDEFLSLHDDPLQVFKDTAAAIPNARISVVRGGTHTVMLEKPQAVNDPILGFLEEAG